MSEMLKTMINRIEHNKNALKTKRYYVEDLISNEELIILVEEIERLNIIINEFEDILKIDIKACDNKFENVFDRNYRRLILEEKLEQLQELKGSGNND